MITLSEAAEQMQKGCHYALQWTASQVGESMVFTTKKTTIIVHPFRRPITLSTGYMEPETGLLIKGSVHALITHIAKRESLEASPQAAENTHEP